MTPPLDAPILVTGATGNVGAPLVRALGAAGHRVRAATREGMGDGAPEGTVRFAFDDRASWPAALDGVRAMFLLRPPQISDARGVLVPFLDAAVAAGVRHVVFLSVQGAARNPLVPHHAVERHLARLAAEGHATHTLLRAAFFCQNLSTTHRAEIRDQSEIVVPAGDGRTAFVDARDVAAVAALALADPAAHANQAYELTSGEALTYHEVAAILGRVLGRPVRYGRPGPLAFWRHRRALGDAPGFVLVMEALYATARLGLAAHVSPELARLLAPLGQAPITVERFARDHLDAWR